MKIFTIQILLLLTFSSEIFAEIRVVFLRQYDSRGNIIRLEPNGPGFFHTAIRYKNKWLHAHPWGGVQVSDSLSSFGVVSSILINTAAPEPEEAVVSQYLGHAYDPLFNWNDTSYYCSELIGLLLAINPRPMKFEGDYWKHYFEHYGLSSPPSGPGISPDGLYSELLKQGFKEELCVYNLLK